MVCRKSTWILMLVGILGWLPPVWAAESILPYQFGSLHKLIKPQPGESRWLEIPWLLDVHAAREKAAALGKPIFVMSGGGATAIGPC